MDTSFELFSSMSPRIKSSAKTNRKCRTFLALKKPFRESLSRDLLPATAPNESLHLVESSSESVSTFSGKSKESESKASEKVERKNSLLSATKLKDIENWIEGIDEGDSHNLTIDWNKVSDNPFDSDSFLTLQKLDKDNDKVILIEDSFAAPKSEDLFDQSVELSPNKAKSNDSILEIIDSPDDFAVQEKILDEIYGQTWRARRDEVLPKSTPKIRNLKPQAPSTENKENKPQAKWKDKKILPKTEPKIVKKRQTPLRENDVNKDLTPKVQKIKLFHSDDGKLKNLPKEKPKSRVAKPLKAMPEHQQFLDDIRGKWMGKKDKETPKLPTRRRIIEPTSPGSSDEEELDRTMTELYETKCEEREENVAKTYGFLASLSAGVPLAKSDMSARMYVNNYKTMKTKLADKLFKMYNNDVFQNKIPESTEIEWSTRLRGTAGKCHLLRSTYKKTGSVVRTVKIILSSKVLDSANRLRDTLIHEMCHAATWMIDGLNDGHGPHWKLWAIKAMETYPELPPIKRCHDYVLNTKFTYKCVSCGYSIGRHTKSLDIERKRCGYCMGRFEILVNKITKNGEKKVMAATPKKPPTPFAQFVKDNYASLKSPSLKHGDVMKVLSRQFANLKMQSNQV